MALVTPLVVNLKAEVEAAVKPYASSKIIPPFSVAEIMVMAWVCNKTERDLITDEEISDWIFLTFGYYRKLALKELHQHGYQECAVSCIRRNDFHDFVYQRTLQLKRLDVPLRTDSLVYGAAGSRLTSTGASSRRFLRRALKNELQNFTRFFDLPAELRVRIYEDVFRPTADLYHGANPSTLQYYDSEFHPWSKNRYQRLAISGLCPKSFHERTMKLTHKTRRGKVEAWATEPTSELMALLCVNRQIFQEAMPVFYNVNHFCVCNVEQLSKMLRHCGARRRACFTNISFIYDRDRLGMNHTKIAFGLLKDVKCLRRLGIMAQDYFFLNGPGALRSAIYDSVAQVPGMKLLGEVRVRELNFFCKDTKIESFLRPRMMKTNPVSEIEDETKSAKPSRKNGKKATRSS